jgi:hypothetical protein
MSCFPFPDWLMAGRRLLFSVVLDPVATPCGGRAFDVLVWSEPAEGCSP